MSTLTVLKEYLLGKERDADNIGYLLDPNNNGKTAMISGAWGSGKTHFWQNEIEFVLKSELKEKACAYISLYGMDSLKEIKEEVFFKASKENDYLSEEIEVFGFDALSTIADNGGEISKGLKTIFDLNKYRRSNKGKNKLKDGGIICFDDFERKSKKVDLNDLFGFISQLAIGLNCKVVIILNSDVFEGKEANVFKTVKEKTVNKFLDFDPPIEELFASIYESNSKYEELDGFKEEILNVIKETKEKNARIYIQVLDNCLEWINKGYEKNVLRTLVLNSICFMLNHFILSYPKFLSSGHESNNEYVSYTEINYSPEIKKYFNKQFTLASLGTISAKNKIDDFIENLKKYITGGISNETIVIKDNFQKDLLNQIKNKELEINVILKYGYQIFVAKDIEEEMYNQISNFIKTGILPPKEDNI